ncbi:MAG: hypothetical protein ACD_46C00463G0009 [uncultured bacterium]|nr:MAG: hypothetical protein ACD_46C00463G0009 [uncultured bacterium]
MNSRLFGNPDKSNTEQKIIGIESDFAIGERDKILKMLKDIQASVQKFLDANDMKNEKDFKKILEQTDQFLEVIGKYIEGLSIDTHSVITLYRSIKEKLKECKDQINQFSDSRCNNLTALNTVLLTADTDINKAHRDVLCQIEKHHDDKGSCRIV